MAAAANYVEMSGPKYGLHHLPHLGHVLQIPLPDDEDLARGHHAVVGLGPQKDSQDNVADQDNARELREKMLDKTIADSFPASDPPSTDPAPLADSFAA